MHGEHGSWLNAILHLLPENVQHHWVDVFVLNSWLVIILLVLLAWLGTRRLQMRPRGLQNLWEMYVAWLRDFCRDEIGPGGEKHAPLLGTLFIYILFLNLFGLVPGFITPTMTLNMTVPLALFVFLYVQWTGFTELGPGAYLMHFIGEPIVSYEPTPRYFLLLPVVVLFHAIMLIVHLIGELAKPLSLAVRLFGNMFGEETSLVQMAALGAAVFAVTYIPVPVQFINVALHLLVGPIQAFIFFILSAAYISMAVGHAEHEDEHNHQVESVSRAS